MSWLKDRSAAKEADQRQRQEALAAEQRRQQQAADAAHALQLREMLEAAREFRGQQASELEERPPIVLKKGESVFLVVSGCILIEPRSSGGQWQGGSQGLSIRVPGTRSMRYRIGSTRGTFVAGQQVQTPIDQGTCVVTDERVVFVGSKSTREWLWAKCIAVDHADDGAYTIIGVSNRQKASGIGYSAETASDIRFRFDLALAVATGTTDELVADLEGDLDELQQALGLPTEPLAPGSLLPPPAPLA